MKNVDVKITITNNNGEDNVLTMFVPIAYGEEHEESESLISEIAKFINSNIVNKAKRPNRVMYEKPIWKRNSHMDTENQRPSSFYRENFMDRKFGVPSEYDSPSPLFRENTSTTIKPRVFGLEENDYIPIEASSVNFLSLELTKYEKLSIRANLPIGTLKYNIHFNKKNVYRNNVNYKIIDGDIKKIIIEKANYDAKYIKLLEDNTLYASFEDEYFLNKYINNTIDRTGSNEFFTKNENIKTNQSNITVKDYRDANDKKSTVLIYSARGVLYATNKQEKFKAKLKNSEVKKIVDIVDEKKYYIDLGTLDLSVDLCITDDALNTIVKKLNLTHEELKEKVFYYILHPKKTFN